MLFYEMVRLSISIILFSINMKLVYQLYRQMIIGKINQKQRSHRSLSRTENSLKKLQAKQLKNKNNPTYQNNLSSNQRFSLNVNRRAKTEQKQRDQISRSKQKTIKSSKLFQKAREADQDQSYLTFNNTRKSKYLITRQGRLISKTISSNQDYSLTTLQNKEKTNNMQAIRNTQLGLNQANAEVISHLRNMSNGHTFNRTISTPRSTGVVQQIRRQKYYFTIQKQLDMKIEGSHKNQYLMLSSEKNPMPSEIRSIPLQSIKKSSEISEIETVKKQNNHFIKTSVPDSINYSLMQGNKQPKQAAPRRQQAPRQQQGNLKTILRIYEAQQPQFNNLQTIEQYQYKNSAKQIEESQRQNSKKKGKKRKTGGQKQKNKGSKKSIYQLSDQINIDQINIVASVEKEKIGQENLLKAMQNKKQSVKRSNNPYLPIEDAQEQKNSQFQNHKDPNLNQQSKSHTKQNPNIIHQEKLEAKIINSTQKPKQQRIATVTQKQVIPKPISKDKIKFEAQKEYFANRIKQIPFFHTKVQLLGELATYFSKNSKYFKFSQESKSFIRTQANVQWHFMVYLFFKYFYSIFQFFTKFYQVSSSFISFKDQQIKQLNEDMAQWQQTLEKIQKSVKKNAKLQQNQQQFLLHKQLIKKKSKENLIQLMDHYFQGKKLKASDDFAIEISNLTQKINDLVTKFLKSLNLTNILTASTQTSIIFIKGIFRVMNSAIIVNEIFFKQDQCFPILDSIQQIQEVTIEKFKKFYEKLTKQILSKR